MFCDEVEVLQQRLVGEKHLKLRVRHAGQLRDAIWFGHAEPVAERVRLAYRLASTSTTASSGCRWSSRPRRRCEHSHVDSGQPAQQ